MSVRLNGSTSGYTELDAPAVAGNNTIRMPASNGAPNQLVKNSNTAGQQTYSQATEDSAGNFAFNSGYGSVAPVYGCRAWVNFNGTGAIGTNQTIRASGNVASVYKNGTGDYTITFETPMPDANYCVNTTIHRGDGATSNPGYSGVWPTSGNAYTSIAASSVRIQTNNSATGPLDMPYVGVSIFR
jgi:hypothetical protein